MPRETPLSTIHLRNMLTVKEAGATVLFLAPGFYHGASSSDASAEPGRPQSGVASERLSVDDLVNFIVGRAVDLIGLDVDVAKRWGE
jgi:4-hydroxy-3-polyprenylbenzoate decarboxylase